MFLNLAGGTDTLTIEQGGTITASGIEVVTVTGNNSDNIVLSGAEVGMEIYGGAGIDTVTTSSLGAT